MESKQEQERKEYEQQQDLQNSLREQVEYSLQRKREQQDSHDKSG